LKTEFRASDNAVDGAMTTTSEDREKKTYIVRNEDSTPRTLVIEHPAPRNGNSVKTTPNPKRKRQVCTVSGRVSKQRKPKGWW